MPIRNGKIANLPNDIREQLNLRLLDGESGRELVAWLNAQAEVQSVLGSQFNASPISEVNLTLWRQGGYLQWLTERECFYSARALAEGDSNLATTGFSAERLLNILTVRIGQLLMRWDGAEPIGGGAGGTSRKEASEPIGGGAGGTSRKEASEPIGGGAGGMSGKEASPFAEVARKARILQGISRSVLAIYRIQSRGSNAPASGLRNDPLAAAPVAPAAGAAPAPKTPLGSQRPIAAENRAGLGASAASVDSPAPAHSSSPRPVASANPMAGMLAAVLHPIPAPNGRDAARIKMLSGLIAPSSVSSNLSQTAFKPDLDLSEILDAV